MEPNDDGGTIAPRLWGSASVVHATVDFWDDPVDVYAVRVRAGQRLSVRLHGPGVKGLQLALWKPGTVQRQRPVAAARVEATAPVATCRAEAELRLPRARRRAGTSSR